jgi:hypothetical protein
MMSNYIRAHGQSNRHRHQVLASERCGCFCCLAIFAPAEIEEWTDAYHYEPRGATALCPRCGIDSVIGSQSAYPITVDFLAEMKAYWFNNQSRS